MSSTPPFAGSMRFGTPLAVLAQEPADQAVLEAASLIASGTERWSAILPVPLPSRVKCQWGESPDHALAVDRAARRDEAEAYLATVLRTVERLGAHASCRSVEAPARMLGNALVTATRCANLVAVAVPSGPAAPQALARHWFRRLLLESGRPCLVMPDGVAWNHAPALALACWSDAPQSSRALHEALHCLPQACSIHLVYVVGSAGARADAVSTASVAAVAAHVQRHHRCVAFEVIDAQGGPPEDCLLQLAASRSADVIVMGGYGHARAMEYVFGGTTEAILQRATTPLLLAH